MTKIAKIICGMIDHDWRYNFVSLPNKRICTRCKRREHWKIGTIPQIWIEGFPQEDKRSDAVLIEKWHK